MKIHPTAVVSQDAAIAADVNVGPFVVVEAGATIGSGCILESRVVVKRGTTLGMGNHVFEGTVLGGLPQHIHPPELPGTLRIGNGNSFRENTTVHVALDADKATVIGDENYFMVNVHIAHDCQIGNRTIFANNVMLAGHVAVDDRAYISGAAAVHQFARIGRLAMVGGQAHITRDVPPFVTVDGLSSLIVGVNHIGLRRAGIEPAGIRRIKDAYRVIYRSGLLWRDVLDQLRIEFTAGPAAEFHDFLVATTRGVTPERRTPPGATVRLYEEDDSAARRSLRAKVG
ncbi:MAG: acyl-ACP--UDP-N-acetylglucosamine O-acyltransferase [Patescibacteria group bacterium]|nr:acyl-ACP--UDP-N-acetylglucosamine O-acyltransferase [Patescibacteria group bacterium]